MTTTTETVEYAKEENKFFKWILPSLVGILFALVALLYNSLTTADANTNKSIIELQKHEQEDNLNFQYINSNLYIICGALKVKCLPPLQNN